MRLIPAYEFKKSFKPASLALVALLALGACGGDSVSMGGSDDGSSTTADEQASTTAPSDASGGGADAPEAPSTGDEITIEGFAFNPADLMAAPGSEISVTNQDDAVHTLTAVDKSVDTGNLEKGQTATITAPQSGELAYFCTIHEYMKGVIRVSG